MKIGVVCANCSETVDHLLISCVVTKELWSIIFSTFGVH